MVLPIYNITLPLVQTATFLSSENILGYSDRSFFWTLGRKDQRRHWAPLGATGHTFYPHRWSLLGRTASLEVARLPTPPHRQLPPPPWHPTCASQFDLPKNAPPPGEWPGPCLHFSAGANRAILAGGGGGATTRGAFEQGGMSLTNALDTVTRTASTLKSAVPRPLGSRHPRGLDSGGGYVATLVPISFIF
jgi:hypothetical protein